MSEERTAVEFLDKLACVRCVTNVCKCDCARGEECLLGLGEHPCTAGELVSGLREVLAKREVEVAARLREMRAEVEGAGLMAMQGEYDRIVMLLDNKTQISYRVSIRDGRAVSVYSPDASGQGKHILWPEGWGKGCQPVSGLPLPAHPRQQRRGGPLVFEGNGHGPRSPGARQLRFGSGVHVVVTPLDVDFRAHDFQHGQRHGFGEDCHEVDTFQRGEQRGAVGFAVDGPVCPFAQRAHRGIGIDRHHEARPQCPGAR